MLISEHFFLRSNKGRLDAHAVKLRKKQFFKKLNIFPKVEAGLK